MTDANIRMTGVGCFAGGITLSRVLRRIVEAYSLWDWSGAEGLRQDTSPAVQALQMLMTGGSDSSAQAGPAPKDEDIAGFFLNFDHDRLNLSVFTRRPGMRCRKYTAPLEELTRLRRSRLH
jgi:hypothetical protein